MHTLLLATALLASPATHSAPAFAELRASEISALASFDWNGDGTPDRAVALKSGDFAIYLSDAKGGLAPAVFKPDFLTAEGGLAGQGSTLSVDLETGSLRLFSYNDAVGRDRFSRTLTVAFRNGAFVIAGFTFSHRDTLDPKNHESCDLNLLTRQGLRDGKKVKTTSGAVPLAGFAPEDARGFSCAW